MAIAWILTVLAILYVTLCMVCKWDKTAQYYIKTVSFAAWYMFTAILVIPCALFNPGDAKNMGWWSFWVKYLQTPWLFGCKLNFVNREELDYDGPCVIVCNHQTAFDQVAVLEVWPKGRCIFLTKKSLKYAGPFGVALMLSGTIFVDRGNTEKAKIHTTQECIKYMKGKKGKLWVYPEGTRSGNRDEALMLPFKKGAFHMAVQAQVPIIPVILSGHKHTYSDKHKTFDNVEITISVLPRIQTSGLTTDDVTSLTDKVRQMMMDTYIKTTPHIKRPAEDNSDDSGTKGVSPEPVETLTSAKSESDETAISQDKIDDLDKKVGIQSVHTDTVAKDETAKDEISQEITKEEQSPHDLETDQPESELGGQKGQRSNDNQVNEHIASAEAEEVVSSDIHVGALNASEIKSTKESDDSPSSNASADSFVFVDSSKIDDKSDVATLHDTDVDVKESVAQEESVIE